MQRRTVFLASLVVIAVIAAIVLSFRTKTVVDVTTAEVTSGTIARHIFATGTLQATRTVDIGAQVSGIVSSLGADFNSIVHKGEIVGRLDPSLYQAAVDQAAASRAQSEAALHQANADLLVARTAEDDARIKLSRATQLAANQLMTNADLDAANIALQEATAAVASMVAQVQDAAAVVQQANAVLSQAKVNLDHTIVRSPIDGIVLNRSVDVGQTVAAAIQAPVLFTIATDLSHLQLQVDVDQSDMSGIEPGRDVTFEVESYPDETFRGVITQVRLQPIAEQTATATTVASSTLAQQTTSMATVVSYATMIDVDNPGERLRPGMTAAAVLAGLQRDHVIRVPNAALSFRPTAQLFQTLGESEPAAPDVNGATDTAQRARTLWTYDGRQFTPVLARLGLSDGQWTEALTGPLHPGDRVVTNAVLKKASRFP